MNWQCAKCGTVFGDEHSTSLAVELGDALLIIETQYARLKEFADRETDLRGQIASLRAALEERSEK